MSIQLVVSKQNTDGGWQFESRYAMRKHIAEGITGFVPAELSRWRLADWPWRKILADAGLLAAFALTSSLLIRR
jgi:hypothetical protein